MSDRYLEIQRDSRLSLNNIPAGRQLHRTPPLASVRKHLDFSPDGSGEDCEEPQRDINQADQDDNRENTMFDFNQAGTEADDPDSMLKGMKGYQLTQSDLEFIEKMKVEKLMKKLQGDLEDVQRALKNEMMLLEWVCASRATAQTQLEELPSCDELTEWITSVLKITSPSAQLSGLDPKALLAMVTKESIQRATAAKKTELARMEKMVAKKKKREAEERGQLEKRIAGEQLKIHGLMSQLSDLKSDLEQQQEFQKAFEMQIDASEEVQAAKTQAKHGGKAGKKAADAARSDLKVSQTGEEQPNKKKTSDSLKKKQKSGAVMEKPKRSLQEARGPPKKVETQESNSETVRGRGRGRPAGPTRTKAAPPKNKGGVKQEEEEEAQSTVLRRSKRIASRR